MEGLRPPVPSNASVPNAPSPETPAQLPQDQKTAQPWAHLLAGACGGAATAVLTSPLDVLRTRLQSNLRSRLNAASSLVPVRPFRDAIASIRQTEGWSGFFRGLGPSMSAVVPATTIKFYVYGNCKRLCSQGLGYPEDAAIVHAQAAIAAGLATATLTNPIWLIKTRLQLDRPATGSNKPRHYKNSLDCLQQVIRGEGVRALFRGLSASYLGTVETAFHLVLYERLKVVCRNALGGAAHVSTTRDEANHWISTTGAASAAKIMAVFVTYPHEVLRTRLRQAPTEGGRPKYRGLVRCFRTIHTQEGLAGLYGGLLPHLLRSIPSAVITFGVYEFVLRLVGSSR